MLGGLASSRLDKILVRDEKTRGQRHRRAVAVPAGRHLLRVTATVKPGVDPALVEKRLDEIIAEYHRQRPDRGRGAPRRDPRGRRPHPRARAGRRLRRQGRRAGRGPSLRRRQRLLQEDARPICDGHAGRSPRGDAAMADRPAFSLRLEPGDRPPYEEAKAAPKAKKGADKVKVAEEARRCRRSAPTPPLDFPDVQHVTLSNGVQLHYAQRSAVPIDAAGAVVRRRLRGRRARPLAACRT